METSLHRQLKALYAAEGDAQEVPLGNYRIDVVSGETLVEIQHGSLAAIRDKIRALTREHRVLVVKPIVVEKRIVRQDKRGGKVLSNRRSPKRGGLFDLFDDLVYFTRVFPHSNLTLETPLVAIEEWRYPGHGRRRRRRANDQVVEDQRLLHVVEVHRFSTARHLAKLLPRSLPSPFHSGHLAEHLEIDRWVAQRIVYCLRQTGAVQQVGKQGNALLYRHPPRAA